MLGHKTMLTKFKNIEIIPNLFSEQNYHEARITRRKMENSWIHENETTLYWRMD